MSLTKVKLILTNPTDKTRQTEADFLVDSGAHYTVLPKDLVKILGLKPSYEQEFVLADGKVIKRSLSGVIVRFQNRELPIPVVLGHAGDSALLGVTTLETFGLMLDPFQRKIYPSKLMLG